MTTFFIIKGVSTSEANKYQFSGAKKHYTIPGHGTKIKHTVVEHPNTVKGVNPNDKPGMSPVNPKAPMQGC